MFTDPRAEHARLFEANFEPSEETLLLAGRYSARSMDATDQSSSYPRTIQTTALITPTAPPRYQQ